MAAMMDLIPQFKGEKQLWWKHGIPCIHPQSFNPNKTNLSLSEARTIIKTSNNHPTSLASGQNVTREQHGGTIPSPLTDALAVWEAFSWHTVAPQTLVHVVTGLPILHPVIGCCGNDQEDVPHSCTKQPSTHKAVHPAPAHTEREQKVT